MDIDELVLMLERKEDMAFFEINPNNPLNQKTATTAPSSVLG